MSDAAIEILDLYSCEHISEFLWGGAVAFPFPGQQFKVAKTTDRGVKLSQPIEFQGWVLGKTSPAMAIEAIANDRVIRRVPIHLSRPDVVQIYPQISEARSCGFVIQLDELEINSSVQIGFEVILADRCRVKLAIAELKYLQDASENPYQSASDVEVISVHLPKTAGTAFSYVLEQVYGSERLFINSPPFDYSLSEELALPNIKAIHGHFPASRYTKCFPNAKRVTWLRDPIRRLISQYFFMKSSDFMDGNNIVHQYMMDRDLDIVEFSQIPVIQNELTQTWGIELDDFDFVGIQEYFKEDVRQFGKIMGWGRFAVQSINPNPYSDYKKQVNRILGDRDLVNKLKTLNDRDIELYESALKLRAERTPEPNYFTIFNRNIQSMTSTGNTNMSDRPESNTNAIQSEVIDCQADSIIEEISPADTMFTGDKTHYFKVGESALHCIQTALAIAQKDRVETIFDLPCGHGRVMRFLRRAFPDANITGCDLDTDGVDFCAKTFDAKPLYSNPNPDLIQPDTQFDLIWCGSLLTHLQADLCVGFLRLFDRALQPGGIAIFTTHGRLSVDWIRQKSYIYGLNPDELPQLLADYDRDGFGYLDYPNVQQYGISLSSPSWVCSQLEQFPKLRILSYTERLWDHHQDVVACMRVD